MTDLLLPAEPAARGRIARELYAARPRTCR